jgi:hypothetical protein
LGEVDSESGGEGEEGKRHAARRGGFYSEEGGRDGKELRVNQTEELEIECGAPGIAVGTGEPVEAAKAGRASIEIEEGRAKGLERSASKPKERALYAMLRRA